MTGHTDPAADPTRLTDDDLGHPHAVGLREDSYTDGDLAHLLNPIIGWLRLDLHDGTAPDAEQMRAIVKRLRWAVLTEGRILADRAAATPADGETPSTIRIPRPAIYTGPKHQTVDEATVAYLREAAGRVRKNRYWGSGVTALVASVLDNVAAALTEETPDA